MFILGWFVTSSGHLYNIWKLWQFVLNLDVQSWPSLDVNMVFNIWTLHWVIYLDVMWKSWTTKAIETAWKSVYNASKFDSEKTSTTVRGGHTDVNTRRSADVEKTSPAVTKQSLYQTKTLCLKMPYKRLCTGFSLSGEHEKVIVPIQAGHKHERSLSPV